MSNLFIRSDNLSIKVDNVIIEKTLPLSVEATEGDHQSSRYSRNSSLNTHTHLYGIRIYCFSYSSFMKVREDGISQLLH